MKRLAFGSAIVAAAFVLSACSGGTNRFTPSYAPAYVPQGAVAQDSLFPDAGTTIKALKWGKMPAGAAGTAFKKPAKLVLQAIGKNHKPIKGLYATAITLTDSDTTGGSKLFINGKPATKKNTVKKSTDVITLKYTGLAIAPATFTAKTKGVKKAALAVFSPTASAIVYTGPTVASAPELDLYATTGTGSTGAFTATQAGWSGTFGKAFTYGFAPVSGKANNCPGGSGPAYTLSPGSGSVGTSYTATATSTAPAGECMMTITGGAGKTLSVLLTFTTSGIGINKASH